MKATVTFTLAMAFAAAASAAAPGFGPMGPGGFADTGDVCYSWQGGHKSAGSFSRCQPSVTIAVLTPMPPPVAAAPPPSPIMMPMAPQQTCAPAPTKKPVLKKKRKPLVKC